MFRLRLWYKLRHISLSYVVSLIGFFFNVLLTVHLSVILVINQLDAQNRDL